MNARAPLIGGGSRMNANSRLRLGLAVLWALVAALAALAYVMTRSAVPPFGAERPQLGEGEMRMAGPQGRFGLDRFGRIVRDLAKQPAPCPRQTDRTAVILAMGQSNAANHAGQRFASRHGERIVNFFNGECFVAGSPLLGATGMHGEYWTESANALLDSGAYDSVVLRVVAVAGVEISRFARDGDLNPLVAAAAADLARGGYRVTHALWVQGESDALAATSADDYQARFLSVLGTLRAAQSDPRLRVFVGVATKCLLFRPYDPQSPVALAQKLLGESGGPLRAGVDSDALLSPLDRYDDCHFAGSGAEKAARAWAELIVKDRLGP